MSQNLQHFAKFQKIQLDNLVDFEKCCKTHIYLQKSVPIQLKTSNILLKICQKLTTALRDRRAPVRSPPAPVTRAVFITGFPLLRSLREGGHHVGAGLPDGSTFSWIPLHVGAGFPDVAESGREARPSGAAGANFFGGAVWGVFRQNANCGDPLG